ncbi:lysophospholipid acyltransferase family protein [Hydrogenophaga sp. 2FB]|uniref:lysophospholipid acyltransferase family protein n=1 Tax=Hydrogenophaga sp. 2FB TaxID=2502187 RepID=UPI001BB1BE9F|nr:lysophospholipid acyltransferase family protein [Hydrogenophaga sp. 2FB]
MTRGVTTWIGRTALRLAGWRVDPAVPQVPKYVLLSAPHTSNWDFVVLMAAGMALGIWPHWVGKHTLFRPPFGTLARALRGIPVDRRAPSNMVAQLAGQFARRERLVLAMPPEGTRGRAAYWKSGFYRVALAAKVPVAMGYVDFTTRTAAIGPLLMPTGDVRADMEVVRAFYAGKQGRHPERQGPIRLEAEDRSGSASIT